MMKLQDLMDKAAAVRKTIAECAARIAALHSQLDADKQAVIDCTAVDINDRESLLNLAARKQAIEVVPAQIEQLDSAIGEAARELIAVCESMRRALVEASAAEQQMIIKEITALLSPYSIIMAAPGGGSFNPAAQAAASMPIISSIAAAVNFTSQPPSEGNGTRGSAAQSAERFDAAALDFGNETEAIARRYLGNGSSLIFAPFKRK